jgi:hypothetical protein
MVEIMKFTENTSEPFNALINGQSVTVRQHIETFKVSTDDDMIELAEAIHKGREVVLHVQNPSCSYVMVRELQPSKLAIPGGQL